MDNDFIQNIIGLKWRNTFLFYKENGESYEEYEVLKQCEFETKTCAYAFHVLKSSKFGKEIETYEEIWSLEEIIPEYSHWLLVDLIKNSGHRLQDIDIAILKKYYSDEFLEEE